jgi:hypothetical protein
LWRSVGGGGEQTRVIAEPIGTGDPENGYFVNEEHEEEEYVEGRKEGKKERRKEEAVTKDKTEQALV